MQSFWVMLFVFVGRVSSFWEPIAGAIVVTYILEEITSLKDYQTLVFGAIIILIMLFLRDGLVTLPSTTVSWIKKFALRAGRKKASVTPAE